MTNEQKNVSIGADHAGYEYKQRIAAHLTQRGFSVEDSGTFDAASVDYPDIAHRVCRHIGNGKADKGVLLCGSGVGMVITANRYPSVRAALCWHPEIAGLARKHNDANVLCLPARFMRPEEAIACVDIFFETAFDGGRHAARVQKINL